jgi:uncharacterized protein (TIGR03118 family)
MFRPTPFDPFPLPTLGVRHRHSVGDAMSFIRNWKNHGFWSALGAATILAATSPALAGFVTQTNIISDGIVPAEVISPNFFNPWGMSYPPGGPFWISVNNFGTTVLVQNNGVFELTVNIPPPAGQTFLAAPTGQVFNPTNNFVISENGQSAPALFLFVTEDGTISGWNPALDVSNAILAVDNSQNGLGAVYKGLGIFTDASGTFLLAANLRSTFIEVYDTNFHLVRKFRDPRLPADWGPFNVQVLPNNQIYVTYAKQDPGGHDETNGLGNGAVERIDIFGTVLSHIPAPFVLNNPWGLALAPPSWGRYANSLLVGNFGDGHIHSFNPMNFTQIGTIHDASGAEFFSDGLWGLIPGDGGISGSPNTIFFTAGPNQEMDGLFGSLNYTLVDGQ